VKSNLEDRTQVQLWTKHLICER